MRMVRANDLGMGCSAMSVKVEEQTIRLFVAAGFPNELGGILRQYSGKWVTVTVRCEVDSPQSISMPPERDA